MYSLWQDLSVDTSIFDLVALTLTLTYFWTKLKLIAAGGISPVRTDPDLVSFNNNEKSQKGIIELGRDY